MEASQSAFEGQGIEDPNGDPFGDDGGMGEFAQSDPFAEQEQPQVVDREGEPVDEAAVTTALDPQAPASTSSDPAVSDGGTSDPTASANGSQPDPEPDPTPAASTSSAEPGAGDGSEPAPEPKAKKGDTRRKYLLFTVAGPGRFAEVSWMEKGGEMVPKGTNGARKQTVALVHDTAEALATGYAALGSPNEGCALVAVAANYFRVRTVAPKVQKPSKVPLNIS